MTKRQGHDDWSSSKSRQAYVMHELAAGRCAAKQMRDAVKSRANKEGSYRQIASNYKVSKSTLFEKVNATKGILLRRIAQVVSEHYRMKKSASLSTCSLSMRISESR